MHYVDKEKEKYYHLKEEGKYFYKYNISVDKKELCHLFDNLLKYCTVSTETEVKRITTAGFSEFSTPYNWFDGWCDGKVFCEYSEIGNNMYYPSYRKATYELVGPLTRKVYEYLTNKNEDLLDYIIREEIYSEDIFVKMMDEEPDWKKKSVSELLELIKNITKIIAKNEPDKDDICYITGAKNLLYVKYTRLYYNSKTKSEKIYLDSLKKCFSIKLVGRIEKDAYENFVNFMDSEELINNGAPKKSKLRKFKR